MKIYVAGNAAILKRERAISKIIHNRLFSYFYILLTERKNIEYCIKYNANKNIRSRK